MSSPSFPAPRPPSALRGWPARFGIALVAALALALALGLAAPAAQAQPRYTITTAQIHDALAEKMPRRYPVAGLLDLDLQVPQLRMLPAQNRVNAVLPVIASGPLLSGGQRGYAGTFDVDFALRYEASDRTLRAHQVHVNTLRIDGLKPPMSELLNAYAQQLATQSLGEVVLHTLRPQDLALADGLGMQPGPITVTERGLRVDFVQKPAP